MIVTGEWPLGSSLPVGIGGDGQPLFGLSPIDHGGLLYFEGLGFSPRMAF